MPDEFPVFGLDGKLMGNLSGNYGQQPEIQQLPALPIIEFAPTETSRGAVVTSQGAAAGNAGVIPNGAPANAIGKPLNAQPTPAGSVATGSIADYFLRGIIIVLGFIFVAVGLNMFKPGIVPNPVKAVRG